MRLIATAGPACPDGESIAALGEAGADQIRLNASHLDPESLAAAIHRVGEGGFAPSQVVVDLQGGKTRLGSSEEQLVWCAGEKVHLGAGPDSAWPWVDRPSFLRGLRAGDHLRIDDGRLEIQVTELARGRVSARVLAGGAVRPRKGIALVGRTPGTPADLLPRDQTMIEVARSLGVGSFAVSYANDAAQLALVRQSVEALSASSSSAPVEIVAKIEHPLAIERLASLSAVSDVLWLCRGDLGAEVGIEHLPRYQARVLDAADGTPLVVAGQVLHHLTKSPRPTRSEACHVAELVWRGAAGFVLSDETATGPHGVEAVRWLRRLVEAASLR